MGTGALSRMVQGPFRQAETAGAVRAGQAASQAPGERPAQRAPAAFPVSTELRPAVKPSVEMGEVTPEGEGVEGEFRAGSSEGQVRAAPPADLPKAVAPVEPAASPRPAQPPHRGEPDMSTLANRRGLSNKLEGSAQPVLPIADRPAAPVVRPPVGPLAPVSPSNVYTSSNAAASLAKAPLVVRERVIERTVSVLERVMVPTSPKERAGAADAGREARVAAPERGEGVAGVEARAAALARPPAPPLPPVRDLTPIERRERPETAGALARPPSPAAPTPSPRPAPPQVDKPSQSVAAPIAMRTQPSERVDRGGQKNNGRDKGADKAQPKPGQPAAAPVLRPAPVATREPQRRAEPTVRPAPTAARAGSSKTPSAPAAPPRTPSVSVTIGRIELHTRPADAARPPPVVRSPRAHEIDPGLSFESQRGGRW
ncbi:MAG: hypothetical protein IPK82_35835 [Polyangiaceae bacterium]|nr:hypothetical protein [Polyangiaceae bacterium]